MLEEYFEGQQPLDFDEFADHLVEQGLQLSPSKIHGALCGSLVGDARQDAETCLAGLSQALESDLHGALAEACQRLVRATLDALVDEAFEFHLFLPDDEEELSSRVQSLSDWCSGFLAGYAFVVAEPGADTLAEEISEILRDMAAIAAAELDRDEDEEASEQNLFELTEYLRFGTLNLYMEALEKLGEDSR
jgi:uncharacterized protein YgfB (UPF0149 family)